MGYPSDGGMGIIGQVNWYRLPILEVPKPIQKPIIRDESNNPPGSKKVNPRHYSSKVDL